MVRFIPPRFGKGSQSLQESWSSFFKRLARFDFQLKQGVGEVWKGLEHLRLQVTWYGKAVFSGHIIEEGALIPKPLGFAYYDFDRDCFIAHLLPINLIVWFWHDKLRYWLKFPPKDEAMWNAYLQGFRKGLERASFGSIQVVGGWTDKSTLDNYRGKGS